MRRSKQWGVLGGQKCCESRAREAYWRTKCCARSVSEGWVAENGAIAEPGRCRVAKSSAGVVFGKVGWPKMLRVPRQGGFGLPQVRRAEHLVRLGGRTCGESRARRLKAATSASFVASRDFTLAKVLQTSQFLALASSPRLLAAQLWEECLFLSRRVLAPLIGEPILQKVLILSRQGPRSGHLPPHGGHFLNPSCKEFTSGRGLFGGAFFFGFSGRPVLVGALGRHKKASGAAPGGPGRPRMPGVAPGGLWCPKMLQE